MTVTPIPTRWTRRALGATAAALLAAVALPARADAVDALKAFVTDVKSGRAAFTQVVTSADGAKRKTSSGGFEFQRPNRFRFDYRKPYEQTLVADGARVWFHDPDLNQVTVRSVDQALGATPAAILAGGQLEKDFALKAEADQGGLQWVLATPKAKDAGFQSLRVGFKGKDLAALEILDAFGQRSRLDFAQFEANAAVPAARFQFKPPAGADVLQP